MNDSTASPRIETNDPLRVAIVGCGAVARQFHIPVIAGHGEICLAAFVDQDAKSAQALGHKYQVSNILEDASKIDRSQVDAVVVATPPFHHALCCIELARRGFHVLVEKPMALTYAEGEEMVRTADEAGVVLAVGLFRRLLNSSRMMRALIEGRALGEPTGFTFNSGAFYGWPAATLGNMRKELAGGGVLIDMGSHVLDQLLYFLPGRAEVLEYRDNSLGGIESDCQLRLRIHHEGRPLDGVVELSRTRKRPGGYRIECERGAFELPLGENYQVSVVPKDLTLVDQIAGRVRDYDLRAVWADAPKEIGFAAFREEIDDWLGAIRTGCRPQLDGRTALPSIELIERCYRQAKPLDEPWVEEGLRRSQAIPSKRHFFINKTTADTHAVPASPRSSGPGRVLVTGATGFIGCRVAEVLHLRDGWHVRALVHNPGSAARLARLPVEMVQGDLRSQDDMRRVVEGCDSVVHCAIGTSYGQRSEIFAVTVDGTRNLSEAAQSAGVRRFIQISTIAVHGNDIVGVIDETTPVLPNGGEYNESKAAAERVVERAVRDGLPAITLRLANIYGPFGKTFTIDPIERIAAGSFLLGGGDEVPSNTVYVDDVVEAIACALGCQDDDCIGQIFTIGAEDELTWNRFFGYFAEGLGVPLRTLPADDSEWGSLGRDIEAADRRREFGWIGGCLEIAKSPELRSLVRKVMMTDPVGRLPRGLLGLPGVEGRVRRALKLDAPLVYRAPADAGGSAGRSGMMIRRPKQILVKAEKARRMLGYEPAVPRWRAMELTLDWVRHALVPLVDRRKLAIMSEK